jgi:hypothetical protein
MKQKENGVEIQKIKRQEETEGGIFSGFPAGVGNFSLLHCVHTGSGAHPSSYPVGITGKTAGA